MANNLETGNFVPEENHRKRPIKAKVIDLEEIRFLKKVGRTQWNKLDPNHRSHNHPDDPLNCQRSNALKKNLMKV